MEKAFLIGLNLKNDPDFLSSFQELKLLTITAGAELVGETIQQRNFIDQKYFLGSGKLLEIKEDILQTKADVLIVNAELSPKQQKNIEEFLDIKVIDRVGLILDIFASRANTQEAKLQVEQALLEYLLPRLAHMWKHLSKQAGHIGTKGPGETQLESDKRIVRKRIKKLKEKTRQVRQHHKNLREARKKRGAILIALVGYTNAGKSTLMNALTKGDTYVANKLFATLDPFLKKLYLPEIDNVILSDTVGFIQKLPHQLVSAFKATLDEVTEADLLLHVVDASSANFAKQIESVLNVLEEISSVHKPMLIVFNKIDLIDIDKKKQELIDSVKGLNTEYLFLSAKDNLGLLELKNYLTEFFKK